jgi:hypothetical protein
VDGPYAGIVELLAFDRPAPRRRGATYLGPGRRCQPNLDASDLSHSTPEPGRFVFSLTGTKPFQSFSAAKRELDKLSSVSSWRLHDLRRTFVSGMARLGVVPHVADKVLNHQSGTISGVAAVYQRHEFLTERKDALERWGAHMGRLLQSREIKVA